MLSVEIKPSFQRVGNVFTDIGKGYKLQDTIEKFAFLLEGESKKVTPVDTGRLRASINVDIGNLYANIAPHTNYAGFVHWGTRKMRARPFMTWGYESTEKKMPLGKELSVTVEKEFEKGFSKL